MRCTTIVLNIVLNVVFAQAMPSPVRCVRTHPARTTTSGCATGTVTATRRQGDVSATPATTATPVSGPSVSATRCAEVGDTRDDTRDNVR